MMKKITTIILTLLLMLGLASCDVIAGEVDSIVNEATAPLNETIDQLEATKTELEGAKDTLEQAKAALEEAKAKLEAEKAALEDEKAALEGQMTAVEGQLSDLEDQIEALESENRLKDYEHGLEVNHLNELLDASSAKIESLLECAKGNHEFDSVTFIISDSSSESAAEFYCNVCESDYRVNGGATYNYDNVAGRYVLKNNLGISENEYAEKVDLMIICYHYNSYIIDIGFKSVKLLHSHYYDSYEEKCVCEYCNKTYHNVEEGSCTCLDCGSPSHTMDANGLCSVCGVMCAAVSVTVDGVTEYFDDISLAFNVASEIEGSAVVIHNDYEFGKENIYLNGGSYTIDLNGNEIFSEYYHIYVSGADITLTDSVGGGVVDSIVASDGSITVDGGNVADMLTGSDGKIIIKDGEIGRLSVNEKDTVTLYGGSYDFIMMYNTYGTPHDLLADGCAYYDADGNQVDGTTVELDGSWYYLYDVTVAQATVKT